MFFEHNSHFTSPIVLIVLLCIIPSSLIALIATTLQMQITNNHFFNPIKIKHSIKQVTKRNVNETSVSNVKFPKIDEYYVRKKDNSNITDCELRGWVSSFTNHSKYAFVVLVGDNLSKYEKFVVEKKNKINNRR